MKKILGNILLSSGLIVPLKDVIRDMLYEACEKYTSAEEFDIYRFEELTSRYLLNEADEELDDYVKKYILQEYEEEIQFPACVRHALVFFVMYKAIMDSSDEEDAAIYSLSLQNMMIRVKNHSSELKYKSYLQELFYHFESFTQDIIQYSDKYPRDLVRKVFQKDDFGIADLTTQDVEGLRYLSYVAWRQKMKSFFTSLKESNPYLRVALCLEHYFINLPHYGMPWDIRDLMQLCVVQSSSRPKLRQVMKQLEDYGICFSNHEGADSCVLMNMLYNQNVDTSEDPYLSKYFSVKEFFLYLYHELLLDYKLKENGYFED